MAFELNKLKQMNWQTDCLVRRILAIFHTNSYLKNRRIFLELCDNLIVKWWECVKYANYFNKQKTIRCSEYSLHFLIVLSLFVSLLVFSTILPANRENNINVNIFVYNFLHILNISSSTMIKKKRSRLNLITEPVIQIIYLWYMQIPLHFSGHSDYWFKPIFWNVSAPIWFYFFFFFC